MKKLFLLAIAGGLGLSATAQSGNRAPLPLMPPDITVGSNGNNVVSSDGPEGTTATPFWTETFGSGSNTTIPTNWSVAGNSIHSATWKWRRQALTQQFGASLGVLNSPTGGAATSATNDGWMVYDSDSIGDLNPTALPLEGYLTSPVVNCSGRSSVQISFYQWFRRFRDSCFVDVSTNNFGTWTRYSVLPNNTMTLTNTNLPTNPTLTRINITATAANQANVRFRFYYKLDVSTGAGGAFAWLVDDVALAEIDPVELGVDRGTYIMTLRDPDAGYTSFGQYPKHMVDTVFPIGYVTNYGLNAQANTSVAARIFRGTTQVYNQSLVYNVPAAAVDSQLDYSDQLGYLPTDTGLYTIAFNVNQAGDAFADNNTDTARFRISDSLLTMNVGPSTTNYFVQRAQSSADGLLYRQVGIWFEIPQGKSDTINAASVAFGNTTTAGSTAQVQIFKQVVSGSSATWLFKGETLPRTLTAADISTTTTLAFPRFVFDTSNGFADLILDGGYYAAVVRGQGNPVNNTITVLTSESPAYGVFKYADGSPTSFGTLDTSDNQAFSYTYGAPGAPNMYQLGNNAPYVRLHFSNVNRTTGISDVSIATLGAAYPNPANTKVTIPVSLSQTSEVTVSLTNAQGQVLGRQELGKQTAGRGFEISFPTGNLAGGVYFYTVEAAGEKKTGRVVVAH